MTKRKTYTSEFKREAIPVNSGVFIFALLFILLSSRLTVEECSFRLWVTSNL
jgi:hypothetical protein